MQHLSITPIVPGKLKGSIAVPPSKSQTIRALFFGMMGRGRTVIHNPLLSTDTEAAINALTLCGAKVQLQGGSFVIEGVHGRLSCVEDVIDAKNSGLVLRFMGALAALMPTYTVITGDHSIRHRRPIAPLLQGLRQLGAFAESSRQDDFAPILIKGPMRAGRVSLCGRDSQPVSALLMATAFLEGESIIEVENPGETPWIDLTLSWFDRLKIGYEREGYARFRMKGNACYEGFTYTVPADFSSAAFPIGAALVTCSELVLENLDFSDPQGDKKLVSLLQQMGAAIETDGRRLIVKKSKLKGCKIDVEECIDALPILAVIGCYAEGVTEISGAANARIKESDRLSAITLELKKMGAQIIEKEDGLAITSSKLSGKTLFSHHDHRIALSLAVAALGAKGSSSIEHFECTSKTYPTFLQDLNI